MNIELDNDITSIINKYEDDFADFDSLRRQIVDFFSNHPKAKCHVHSVKSRMKDVDHLRDKIVRKNSVETIVTIENFYEKITDLAGVRILLLHQKKFADIKNSIEFRINRKEWALAEPPKAYTWDPEAKKYFETLGYEVTSKDSLYTSVHYLIKNHPESPECCEIQIRTLFEEIWGEVDHEINYPTKTNNSSCRDQIMVLAKLIGAGSRLVDSIFETHAK
jgi:putative GTP pyrophosphokinase